MLRHILYIKKYCNNLSNLKEDISHKFGFYYRKSNFILYYIHLLSKCRNFHTSNTYLLNTHHIALKDDYKNNFLHYHSQKHRKYYDSSNPYNLLANNYNKYISKHHKNNLFRCRSYFPHKILMSCNLDIPLNNFSITHFQDCRISS